MPPKMHLNTRPKFISFSLKTLSAAVVSAMLFSNANAAGLGKLTVLSSLGQPLHAEIELTAVSKDEVGTLIPKLASTEAFRQANIEFNPALFSLRFAIEQRGGRQFIRVTSPQPINEPFIDMLLELGGGGNRLVREYTFLLDPADLRSSQSPQVAPPIILPPAPLARRIPEAAPVETPSAQRVVEERPAPMPSQPKKTIGAPAKRMPAAPSASAPSGNAPASEYLVKKGDSLSKIAAQVKPEGISLDQMLVSLYRANPDAFLDNNMNRLRAGQILAVPDSGTAAGVGNAEARGIVIAQAVDFNSYRSKLAGQVATAAPKKLAEAKQSATGKITTKVEESPTSASDAKDKLKLSKSGTPAGKDKASTIAAGTEEKIAKDKAIAEANSRVKELEKNVNDLNKLLEIKSKNLEEQQKLADAAKAAATKAPPVVAAVAPPAAVKPAEVKPEAAPAVNPVEVKPAEVKPVEAKPAEAQATEPKPAVAPVPAAASASASVPVAIAPKLKPKLVIAPPPEPSLVDEMADNPLFLVLGALLAGIGLFGVYRFWAGRRKQNKHFEDSIIIDSSLKANSLFGSTGGQSVDTNNSVFNSNFTPSSSNLDTNEVDPVAEADVYIAYGRDAQAEEILKEALRTQPGRHAVRVKLLEIYSNRKDLRAFEVLASELYGMTKGEGEDWVQAASLGLALDPNNPLYAAGKLPEQAKPSKLSAPTQPLDEPDLDALLAVTQSDRSLETINTLENSSYFGNTASAGATAAPEAPAAMKPEPMVQEEPKPAPAPVLTSNELDFDLEGIGADQLVVPNTITRVPQPEPKNDFAEINFDFLEETKPANTSMGLAAAPVMEAEAVIDLKLPADDFAPLEADLSSTIEIPSAPMPSAPPSAEMSSSAMEFDLSDITLTLDPGDGKMDPMQESHVALAEDAPEYSNSAEMATKLDLAVAYQEIGDKEGARELLDEVVKGGAPEQAEKARSILQKLG